MNDIYFCGSIRGGRDDVATYQQLIAHLQTHGNVLTTHIGDPSLSSEQSLTDYSIYQRDMMWLSRAKVVVAEVSTPSLGIGWEVCRAVTDKKPVLCLYRTQEGKKLSAIIAGCPDVVVKKYGSVYSAKVAIDDFFNTIVTEF